MKHNQIHNISDPVIASGNTYIRFLILILFLLTVILSGIYIIQQLYVKTTYDYVYIVEPGDSLNKIATNMQTQKIIPNAYAFMLLARIKGDAKLVQAGEYFFEKNSSLSMLLEKMVSGDVMMHSIRIGEGWTFAQVVMEIQAHPQLTKTLDWTNPDSILQQLALSHHKPEGLLYPETYHFPRGFTDAQLLTLAYQEMQDFLTKAWPTRTPHLPYKNPYQALIAASIIEKETSVAHELDQVAGVIVRRLKNQMLLQVDPTVVYGLGAHYDKPLTKADLKFDTPYNTYIHLGLPPTPIAIPSPKAIEAALLPHLEFTLFCCQRRRHAYFYG